MIRYLIGVDEAGRGALAGPVIVAAALMPTGFKIRPPKLAGKKLPLRDSKKLSPRQRDCWLDYFKKEPAIKFQVSFTQPRMIDKVNIAQAVNRSAFRAVSRLLKANRIKPAQVRILTDGAINFPSLFVEKYRVKSIIKGDEKVKIISVASIVAKEIRDKRMVYLHRRYPEFQFHRHKGYGTKLHFQALKKHGPAAVHRLTFVHI